ncbi:hypothetical protein GCM10025857_03940 [Alicyclobacillus contaminans]|uniref:hypothetical protein n=1 Tax=Alicyclobacillus contaminans TaxID=392016 RepID=UPI00042A89D1|nr:hypothetical protein [Alicyclobacillus contaminans]GMA49037.1 hypothetical protein GCM10025857_03940 [Alicyclobacillus contaminans]
MDERLAARLMKLKKGVQELAEYELAKATETVHETAAAYEATVRRRQSAQSHLAACSETQELELWRHYVDALRVQEARLYETWQAALNEERDRRRTVESAYRDVRRWEMVADAVAERVKKLRAADEMRAADERAALMFGRGLAHES